MRVYPLKNADGTAVENAYVIAFEEFTPRTLWSLVRSKGTLRASGGGFSKGGWLTRAR